MRPTGVWMASMDRDHAFRGQHLLWLGTRSGYLTLVSRVPCARIVCGATRLEGEDYSIIDPFSSNYSREVFLGIQTSLWSTMWHIHCIISPRSAPEWSWILVKLATSPYILLYSRPLTGLLEILAFNYALHGYEWGLQVFGWHPLSRPISTPTRLQIWLFHCAK